MTLLTLINTDKMTIATDRLVYGRDEIAHLGTLAEQCEALQQQLDAQEARVQKMCRDGYDEGFANGGDAGYSDALQQLAGRLVELTREANEQRDRLQRSSGDLAIQIVRKIAADLAEPDVLASLAATAAAQLLPRSEIVVKVHADQRNAVAARLDELHADPHSLRVVGDSAVALNDCVLETELGQVKADLDTQLNIIAEKFSAA